MKVIYSPFLFLFSIFSLYSAQACTVFMVVNKNNILVASNEDFRKRNSEIFFVPSQANKYGYVMLGYQGSIQSGMNEKGLFWDGLRVFPATQYTRVNERNDIGGSVLYKILEECTSVNEVISLFEEFYWEGLNIAQLVVCDRSGDGAVLTYTKKGLQVSRRKCDFLLRTNFRIVNEECLNSGKVPFYKVGAKRYKKAAQALSLGCFDVNSCFEILRNTTQSNFFAHTLYSTIMDLGSGDIWISLNGDFSKKVKLNLFEMLKKGKHAFFLSDLFKVSSSEWQDYTRTDRLLCDRNDTVWLNKKWKPVFNKNKAKYYRNFTKDSLTGLYLVQDYFLTGKLQGKFQCSSILPIVLNGTYEVYHPNGELKFCTKYINRLHQKNFDRYYDE